MTTDLFNTNEIPVNKDQQAQDSQTKTSTSDQGLLDELVGPGKKFASIEDLAKGKKTSDEFISRLQDEMRGLREELNRRTSTEDIIAQVRAELKQTGDEETPSVGLDEQAVARIVQSQLTEAQRAAMAEQNMKVVRDALLSKFESEEATKKAIQDKANELGVTVEYLRNNAVAAPKAFLALMGANTQDKTKTSSNTTVSDLQKGSQNTEALPSTDNPKQVKEHYDNLRRTSPTKYWSPQVQKEIWTLMQQGKYPTE